MKILGEHKGNYVVVENDFIGIVDIEVVAAIKQGIIPVDSAPHIGLLWDIKSKNHIVPEVMKKEEIPNIVRAIGEFYLDNIQVSDEFYY